MRFSVPTIVQKENKILRKHALPVSPLDIESPKIKKLISDMKKALTKELDGVAIAAPQIGSSFRIFIVAGKAFSFAKKRTKNSANETSLMFPDKAFINPEIIKISKDKAWMEEGCLSVRYLYGRVERSKKIRVKAYDETGKQFELGVAGLLAQIIQHEVDHLNGILFIDKAKEIVELSKEEYSKHV